MKQPSAQPQPQQPDWENDTHIPPVGALSEYATSSSSTALTGPITRQYSEASSDEELVGQLDQRDRHTPVSVSDDDYITPTEVEDRRKARFDRLVGHTPHSQDLGSSTNKLSPSTSQERNSSTHGLSLLKDFFHPPYPYPQQQQQQQQQQLRLSPDLSATAEPSSLKPYACGHQSCWPSTASTSRACYSTPLGLSDHIKAEHSDDVDSDGLYRCAEGCGSSWQDIHVLRSHVEIFHSLDATPYIYDPPSVEASRSGQTLRRHLAHGHPLRPLTPAQRPSQKLKGKMQSPAQNPSKDARPFLQRRGITAHPGTLKSQEAKTMVNPSRKHSRLTDLNASSSVPDPISPLAELAQLASEYRLNLNGLVSLDNCHIWRGRYATVHSGDLHQKDYVKGIGGDSSGARQSTKVAIKTLRGKPPGDLDDIKRFLEEVHVLSKLHHQNILAPLGLTTELEQTVSVVSLWRGNARDYVQDKTIDPRPLIEGIAQGVNYLHNHQPTAILHGYLKGANVVISDDGQALLTDFGFYDIVRSTFSIADVSHHVEKDIDWMSPEMLKSRSVSAEADVWAFGMTAVELFTRQNPSHLRWFDAFTVVTAQGHLLKRPSVEDACPRMTDMWWIICSQCWRYNPSLRPTMADIVQQIGIIMSPTSSTLDNFTSLASPYIVEPVKQDGTASTSGNETVEGQMANGTKVAVKTFRCSPPRDTHDIERVLHDISTWCKLHHDNILPVLGITTKFDNALSVVSLWMESGNAHDYMRNNDVSPVPVLVGVASGLCYLHSYHSYPICHGNLRGHNILISQGGQALLTDFGLSELLGSSFNPRLVNWTSPEHLDDFKGSPEGDVWAFGMTALELFTRSLPFHDIQDVKQRIIKGPPERPSDCSRLTDKWWKIFSSCWERDPQLRPLIEEIAYRVAQEHFVGLWLRGSSDVWRLFQNMF